jgi:ferrous iron transport protein B
VTQAAIAADPSDPLQIALIGSPNSGKTTLFNALTGSRAKVGNYPGVTVERREGWLRRSSRQIRMLDLPGTYSLSGETPDEQVAEHVIHGTQPGESAPDALVIVVDGTTLARGLGLVAQVLVGAPRPTALVVTMIDEVSARGGSLDLPRLSRILGIPVLGVVGNRGVGIDDLRALLADPAAWSVPAILPPGENPRERFTWVDAVCAQIGVDRTQADTRTDRIDRLLLNPLYGTAIFAAVMVLLFQSIFTWAAPAMDAIGQAMGALGDVSAEVLPQGLLTDLWIDGILAGVGGVLVFLPQIVLLFALIHFLEDVGYMARAAFVVDRVMGLVGLQGRCFIALLSSYACAVPGIMAARSIESPRDRLATILVAPFMTCSARLPVYTLLIAAFVPATSVLGLGLQGLVMLGLYLLGALTALASAALLRSTLLRGQISRFYLELPPYRVPTLRLLGSQVWGSAFSFVRRAGTIILAASIVLWILLAFPRIPEDPNLSADQQAQAALEASAGAALGRAIEPLIEPLGFDWRIGVGLIASLAAREVIVATLSQIYAVSDADGFSGLREALISDVNPETGLPTYNLAVALSLLVFFVFALQCTSTIVVMYRETGGLRWPAFAFGYMLLLAYAGSFVTYRVASALLS